MSENSTHDAEQRFRRLLDERFDGLTRRIDEWLEETRTRGETIQQILNEALQQPFLKDGAPQNAASQEGDPLGDLAEFARDVECTADQGKILTRLIEGSAALAPRVLLFIVKDNTLRGWAGRGFTGITVRNIAVPLSDDTVLGEAARACAAVQESATARDGNATLTTQLGVPSELLAVPLWVRDRVAAILYADTMDGVWYPDAITVMSSLAALSLEALPARARYPRPMGTTGAQATAVPVATEPEPVEAEVAAAASTPSVETGQVHETHEAHAPAHVIDEEEPADLPDDAPDSATEEAVRFARLLVSEIALYNERAIEEGRRTKDLYQRLKDDIERSRKMYEQRFSPTQQGGTNHFRDELIRTLAGGDRSAIAIPWD